jgi:golgi apparatus protein 1
MSRIGTKHMRAACEAALLQIQFFVARDYKLDPPLYRECREDAVKYCHAKKSWSDDPNHMDPQRGPLILPCLYRLSNQDDSAAVKVFLNSPNCLLNYIFILCFISAQVKLR